MQVSVWPEIPQVQLVPPNPAESGVSPVGKTSVTVIWSDSALPLEASETPAV